MSSAIVLWIPYQAVCVAVCFEEKHEIHRVHAQVCEIFYSPDHHDSSKEYMRKERCGDAVREMMPESVDIEVTNGCRENDEGVE